MKKLLFLSIYSVLTYSNVYSQKNKESKSYSEAQLIAFLDSVNLLSSEMLKGEAGKGEEENFRSIEDLDIELSETDMNELKSVFLEADKDNANAFIDLDLADRIFPFSLDTTSFDENRVWIGLVSFTENLLDFDEYAIYIGYGGDWGNDVYFFKGNRIIAYKHNFHRYGIELNVFKDNDGKTVVYFLENFGSGTGIWQFNYFFYKYDGDQLIPVLNVLENGNLAGWSSSEREFWMETTIQRTNPLTFSFVYYFNLPDKKGNLQEILKDSVLVTFPWNDHQGIFKGNFDGRLREEEVLTYYLNTSELYFVKVYNDVLKEALMGKNKKKKNAAFYYLSELKNNPDTKNE